MWSTITHNYYLRRTGYFILVYVLFELICSLLIMGMDGPRLSWDFLSIYTALWTRIAQTIVSLFYWFLPVFIYLLLLPKRFHLGKFDRIATLIFFAIFTAVNAFEDMSLVVFWDEFSSAFNFIAVDYLIYTKEVIGNIRQSYPIGLIILGIVTITLAITWFLRKRLIPDNVKVPSFLKRLGYLAGLIIFCFLSYILIDIQDAEKGKNRYNNELGKDGLYSLFSAFLKNELEYDQFYLTGPLDEAARFLRKDLSQSNSVFREDVPDRIIRTISPSQPELKSNVIVVIMESMGSEFLNELRKDDQDITPCLSALSKESIFFPNTYATGTRSVRGLEAVSASIPPLPGMSIVRRTGNNNLQTIGSLFSEKGYSTKWIYGGYGLFDNMNAFYAANGFEIIDRTSMGNDEITFTTVWGVCDEDLYRRVIKECDKSFEAGKPFLNVVFNTSNHRPYAYPDGKIDIPSKTGRLGAVKYADYAIGQLIDEARSKPWFANTVFMFIADHGAGSAGKKELNPETHLIPLLIYAPGFVQAERHDYPISQIDALPTLLGVLNMPYTASFYGKDARDPSYRSRYFISNYQYIGYCRNDVMVVQKPVRQVSYYKNDQQVEETESLKQYLQESIDYYEHASKWRQYLKQDIK